MGRGEWGAVPSFPMVPGHEVTGIVEALGSGVCRFGLGDRVGVGGMTDSCGVCASCSAREEEHCQQITYTCGGVDAEGATTQGGYSTYIVVKERFVFRMPTNLDFAASAPLLCAGITTYSPMKRWNADSPGKKIGVIGLGGLGHMAVKFGKAWGNDVTVVSRSPWKKDSAMKLGATHFLLSTDLEAMRANTGTLDFIIDTVAAQKPLDDIMSLMGIGGVYCFVGVPPFVERMASVNQMSMVFNRHTVVGSYFGGTKATQEMLDFCGAHNVVSDIERIQGRDINEAWDRVVEGKVQYRFVIDMEGSLLGM